LYDLYFIKFFFSVGYPPFSESISGTPLNDQIIQGLYTFPDEFWSDVSESAKDLIRKMMCIDPVKRLSIADALEHPWLADDHENTTRVENIMYPSTTIKTAKRSACDDDDTALTATDEKPTDSTYSSGRPKRVRH